MSDIYISISGMIGAGKSTLAKALGEKLQLPIYYEPVDDNEYLEDFYKDMKKHSFAMQIALLNKRFKQQQEIIWTDKGAVQDRTIYEDRIFAEMLCRAGLMDKRDFQTYCSLSKNMSKFMTHPNVIVHLDVTPEESLRRIKLRNRECESAITLNYLKDLYVAYEDFLVKIAKTIPVIRVDYSEFKSAEDMAAMIIREYEKISQIREVHNKDI